MRRNAIYDEQVLFQRKSPDQHACDSLSPTLGNLHDSGLGPTRDKPCDGGWVGSQSSKNAHLLRELEQVLRPSLYDHQAFCTPDRIALEIAKIFHVEHKEVTLLTVQQGFLRFAFPYELCSAGVIPLSSSAVAARTLVSAKAERYNNFRSIKHFSIFEMVKFASAPGNSGSANEGSQTIQKMMSAPLGDGLRDPWGVVQVCRKGANAASAGQDFTAQDLELLEIVAHKVGKGLTKQALLASALP